jgi:putative DNA methylase
MTYRKKLIEVVLPLEAINVACAEDKDRKTGHIRNIHKWFAPMPLPALRAIIYATLVDAPSSPESRREVLDELTALLASGPLPPPPQALDNARKRIAKSVGKGETVEILDPFCGGGSTILEAQRLGVRAVGSDLNPIPVLITKALTSIPQQVARCKGLHNRQGTLDHTEGCLDAFICDVLHYANKIRDNAFKILSPKYPLAPNGDTVVAWWWANSVPSPDPSLQGAHTPLVSNWQLSKQTGKHLYVNPHVDREARTIRCSIEKGDSPIEPSNNRCLFTRASIPFKYIRDQGHQQKLGSTLLATVSGGDGGREYFAPDDAQLFAAKSALPSDPPDLQIEEGGLGIRVTNYGVTNWGQVFTPRQQLCLETFAGLVATIPEMVVKDGGTPEYGNAIATILGLCVGKLSQACSKNVQWRLRNGPIPKAEVVFSRADLPFMWDFAETNPFGGSVGDWLQIVKTALRAFDFVALDSLPATVLQSDARHAQSSNGNSRVVVITDPPYFHAIGYASLSEYFYVWVRKALRRIHPDLLNTLGVPKSEELIAAPARHGGSKNASEYFVRGFKETFSHLGKIADEEFPTVIVYAQRQEEKKGTAAATGWEAMLEAIFAGGLGISGTWPVRGTGSTRMRAQSSNALASYILLVCRPRAADSVLGTRAELIKTLRRELPGALKDLQQGNIAPVDLAQAAIGPGMAIFSRYAKVLESDGSPMSVRTALGLINQTLDEVLAEQEGDFDSDTRWALSWYEQFGKNEGPFGDAELLSKAKNTAVNGLVEAGIIKSRGGKVQIVSRSELPVNWDPLTDKRLTAWETTQHLIRILENNGEAAAATLLLKLGGMAETARDLAYRLYSICERKKWADEALAYNGLVIAWPELSKLASAERSRQPSAAQREMF